MFAWATGMGTQGMPMKPRLFDRPVGVLSARSANPVLVKYRQVAARFVAQALSLCIGLLLGLPVDIEAADLGKAAKQGKMVLQEKCGRCHAIEAVGESPLKDAPPMRDIYARFNPRELQAELSEGMVSRHREMPQIEFSDEDVHAILAYLYALAVMK
ncbi:mono/diheme cytochrome c family protein [Bradyrhizobium diazoefficiens]